MGESHGLSRPSIGWFRLVAVNLTTPARETSVVPFLGLLLAILLMGLAATWIAQALCRFRWIGYLGLAIVFYVARHMILEGQRAVVVSLRQSHADNRLAPASWAPHTRSPLLRTRSDRAAAIP